MEQNKVEILETLNNEKMYSLRGDEVGKMCSPEGNDTCRDGCAFITEEGRDVIESLFIFAGQEPPLWTSVHGAVLSLFFPEHGLIKCKLCRILFER